MTDTLTLIAVYMALGRTEGVLQAATSTAALGFAHLRVLWRAAPAVVQALVDRQLWEKHRQCCRRLLGTVLGRVDGLAEAGS
jgi:hypothetical protein